MSGEWWQSSPRDDPSVPVGFGDGAAWVGDGTAAMIPDPGSWPGHRESPGSGSPLTPEQEGRLREAASFYLRDGNPHGARAYLVYARRILTGGPSTQDWIDAAKYVGGFVLQTSAAVVAIAGCPATSGATCLIATALANGAGACVDGCNTAELAANVAAFGIAAKAGYAVHSAGLSETEELASRVVTDAARTAAGADDIVNAVRLRAQLIGQEIAVGHAFEKHVRRLGEFPWIRTRRQFAAHIEEVILNGEMRLLSAGRSAHWKDGTIVIRTPNASDGGTAFRPHKGYQYFLEVP